jgi:signal peptidase II
MSNLFTRPRVIGLVLAAAIFIVDQWLKNIMIHDLRLREVGNIHLLPFFDLTWVENYGVSLGLLTANSPLERGLVTALTALIATVVAVWLWREKNRQDVFGLGLILGGALGNILDRVRFGHVVDFADLHFGEFRPFLVFNIADAAITIGVLILFLRALLVRDKPKVEADA